MLLFIELNGWKDYLLWSWVWNLYLFLSLSQTREHDRNRGSVFVQTQACDCVQHRVHGSIWPEEAQLFLDPSCLFQASAQRPGNHRQNIIVHYVNSTCRTSSVLPTFYLQYQLCSPRISSFQRQRQRTNQILSRRGCRSKWSMSLHSLFL